MDAAFYGKIHIPYAGADADQVIEELREDWTAKRGYFFRSFSYASWLPVQFEFRTAPHPDGILIQCDVSYCHTREQEWELRWMADDVVSKLIDREMTEREKFDQIHRYLVLTKYSSLGTSPYGLIKGGHGDERAYAMLAYQMLNEASLSTVMSETESGIPLVQVRVDGN